MSISTRLSYHDCCFLTDIDLTSERIQHLLECRFRSNSSKTSFDFKSFSPEQPLENIKVSRSFLRCEPKLNTSNDYEENYSSYSSSSSDDEQDEVFSNNDADDDRLNKLAEWDPLNFQSANETDDDDDEDNTNDNADQLTSTEDHSTDSMDVSTVENTPNNTVEDLLVTYVHRPLKIEPISDDDDDNVFEHPPQLDGQIDLESSETNKTNNDKHFDEVVARIRTKFSTPHKAIPLHNINVPKTKFCINDDKKKKSSPSTRRRSSSTKIEAFKDVKISKRTLPPLLTSLLKTNEDIIRPLQDKILSNTQKVSRLSSDTSSRTNQLNKDISRKSTSIDERRIKPLSKNSTVIMQKQKSLPENLQNSNKSKEKSASDHMTIAQKKLTHFQNTQPPKFIDSNINSSPFSSKERLKTSLPPLKSKSSDVRKIQSTSKKSNLNKSKVKTLKKLKRLDRQSSSIQRSESSNKTRPMDYFDGCIVINDDDDDDDIEEIKPKSYSIVNTIHHREKLLDHIVHSPGMRVKWLINLDSILLEHISICHGKNIRPINAQQSTTTTTYSIDSSLISTIIINFLKLFLLRNSSSDQENVAFIQFGFTSYLRYLFVQLPTYNHIDEKDLSDTCSHCHQYSLIINILFDLLFDLLEFDLCENSTKNTYRSSLIEDDYFTRFIQMKISSKEPFYRIRMLIYFIELIGIHMNKCSKKKIFQFNQKERQFFRSLEDFLQQILSHSKNLQHQRISVCFNVIELCLLFVNEKQIRIEQMAAFLVELCEIHSNYLEYILFDKNLLSDIRLLIINELFAKKFHRKFFSIDHIPQIFTQIHQSFNSVDSLDTSVVLLVRSLFHTYADLIFEMKSLPLMYSSSMKDIQRLLHHQLEITYEKLRTMAYKELESLDKIKYILCFFHLLKCKWNQL